MKSLITVVLIATLFSCDSHKKDNSINENIKHEKYYYESGELLSQGFKKDDSLFVGTWIMYFKNGQIKTIKSYDLNGNKPHGFWQYFYPNGFVHSFRTYKNDKWDGIVMSFTSKGEIIQKCIWREGVFDKCEIDNSDSLCQEESSRSSYDPKGKSSGVYKCINCRWVFERELTSEELQKMKNK